MEGRKNKFIEWLSNATQTNLAGICISIMVGLVASLLMIWYVVSYSELTLGEAINSYWWWVVSVNSLCANRLIWDK